MLQSSPILVHRAHRNAALVVGGLEAGHFFEGFGVAVAFGGDGGGGGVDLG
jgi:hypothetical protein